MIYAFGAFTLDTGRAELARDGQPVHVEPQVRELIRLLVENAGRVVTREEILQRVWDGRFVSDAALSSRIKSARQALGDNGRDQRMIETRHGLGFRLVPAVQALGTDSGPAAAAAVRQPAGTDAGGPPTIAVLPFDAFTAGPEAALLADGLTEEVITGLARFRVFSVIARNSVFALKGRPHDIRALGRTLGADYVVEGSVLRAGSRIRVHAQLIETPSALHVWADRFEVDESDLFALFDEVCARIVGALQPELLEVERQKAARLHPRSLSAWQLFVRAQAVQMAPTRDANAEARQLLARAAELEPEAPRIHSAIALTHLWDVQFAWTADVPGAVRAAEAALARVGDRLAEDAWALIVAGGVKVMLRDHEAALGLLRAAIQADPNSARAHSTLALVLALSGRHREALAEADRAERLSPADLRNVLWDNARGIATFALGDFAGTLAAGQRMVAARPDYLPGYRLMAAGAVRHGDRATAAAAAARVIEMMPGVGARAAIAMVPYRNPAEAAAYAQALIDAGVPA
jgi:TolB-like protein